MTGPAVDPTGTPEYLASVIREMHAAKAAGDEHQVQAAQAEITRVTQSQNAAEPVPTDDDMGSRFLGGVKGAAEGVGDAIVGTGKMGARLLKASLSTGPSSDAPGILKDAALAIPRAVGNIRDVTQQFRSGDASPEDLARAWTGGSATTLGPMTMLPTGESGIVPRAISDAASSVSGKIGQGLLSLEKTVAPGRAYARLRLQQAAAKAAEATPAPPPPGETVLDRAARTGELPDPSPATVGPSRIPPPAPEGTVEPVIQPSGEPSSYKPMNLKTPGYDAAVARNAAARGETNSVQGVSQVLQHPAYLGADKLAARIIADPNLVKAYPQFAGLSPEEATTTLQSMILDKAGGTGKIPPLTSLPKFLSRLGEDAIPGRPDLGKVVSTSSTQRAAPATRVATPSTPSDLGDLQTAIKSARAFGTSERDIAAQLAKRGISPSEVHAAMGTGR